MAPRKKNFNGFALFMLETKQTLWKRGIKMDMGEMPKYCENDWKKMSADRKECYKMKAKQLKKINTKYTSIGEKVEDVKRQVQENKSQSNAMYLYIEELVRVKPAYYYLPKQKFILIHVNSYTSKDERFYFPAEISMAEFSLERGLIRIFHQLVGFDSIKTKAPEATIADIDIHSKYNHQIGPYVKLSCNYKEILLKMISFIIDKDIDDDVLNDPNLDIPPIYTAHTSTGKELMITSLSLLYLYESVIQYANRNNFERLFSIYHLDKLFMEMKNVSYEIKNPNKTEKALPSVAMATNSLIKDMVSTIIEIGCSYHEKLNYAHVCSNYYVSKWIYIISTHCCQYFNIKLIIGCHYDFDLSIIETRIQKNINDLYISKPDCIFKNSPEKKLQVSTTSRFSSFEGRPTSIQRSIWSGSEHKVNPFKDVMSTQGNGFHALGNAQGVTIESSHVVENNSWRLNANPPFDNSRKVIPEGSPVFGKNSWRLNAKPPFDDSQKAIPERSHIVGTVSWRSNAKPQIDDSRKVIPEGSPVFGVNSCWRLNTNPPFDDSQKATPERSHIVGTDSWRSNVKPQFGNSRKVISECSPVFGTNSWRSNSNHGKGIVVQTQDNVDQLNENKIDSSKKRRININQHE